MEMLKNCPYCGSKAKIRTSKDSFDSLTEQYGGACVVIECKNIDGCGVQMFCFYESDNYDIMCNVAIDRWNRRVPVG